MGRDELAVLKMAGVMHGVMPRALALEHLSKSQVRHRVESKAWVRLFPSVYRVEGAPVTWRQKLMACSAWVGKHGAISHDAAAALHGLEGFAERHVEVSLTRDRRTKVRATIHLVESLPDRDVEDVEHIRVTTVPRTLVDLAGTTDNYTLRRAVDQALREKKTTLRDLFEQLEHSEGRRGVTVMRSLLRELAGEGGPSESVLEEQALELIEAAGLPRPTKQKKVRADKARRLDLCFVEQKVVVEVDGYAFHSGVDRFEDDRRRDNALLARGYLVLHWTYTAMSERGEALVEELSAILKRR